MTPAPSTGNGPVAKPEPESWTVRRLLAFIRGRLEARGVDSPRICAEILLCHVLDCDRLRLYMEADRVATDAERARLRDLVARASRHEPVQYLVGSWPFRGRTFEVSPATLIPRPSSEGVVEAALAWLREQPGEAPVRMADVGTGSGNLAISIVAETRDRARRAAGLRGCAPLLDAAPSVGREEAGALPEPIRCCATDIAPAAVELARRNVARQGLAAAIELLEGSLLAPLERWTVGAARGELDLVVSNPPYVSDREWDELEPNVRDYEPALALRGGREGLDVVRPLVVQAAEWLRPGGLLVVEIGHAQRDAVLQLVADRALWRSAKVRKDHEDFWRVLVAERA
jgi:release factor glutamine methyltransferase